MRTTRSPPNGSVVTWPIDRYNLAHGDESRPNGAIADGRLDDTNRRLLAELQDDARLSLAELGRRVGLSSPAVAERSRGSSATASSPATARRRPARARPRAQRRDPDPARARPARNVAELAARDARGGRVQAHHRRGLLRHARPRPRRPAPRGGHRPLRGPGQTTTSIVQSAPVPRAACTTRVTRWRARGRATAGGSRGSWATGRIKTCGSSMRRSDGPEANVGWPGCARPIALRAAHESMLAELAGMRALRRATTSPPRWS